MKNKYGLTLIELILVISLLSTFFCISVPCFGSLYKNGQKVLLETASKELLTDLRLAQEKARSEGLMYHVYFNEVENSYMIYSYKNMNNCIYKQKKLPEGISFDKIKSTYEECKISFNNRGKPYPRPCTISLKNRCGEFRCITIQVATDYISLKDNEVNYAKDKR